MCPLGLQYVISSPLFYTTDECADSTVLAEWQFCEPQDHVSSMNHVAPVQANLNPIYAELCFSCYQGP